MTTITICECNMCCECDICKVRLPDPTIMEKDFCEKCFDRLLKWMGQETIADEIRKGDLI